jgi:cobalt-zinc-cadmium efflux system protein
MAHAHAHGHHHGHGHAHSPGRNETRIGIAAGLDARRIAPDLVHNLAGVRDVHHVHVWSITQERQMVTLHACIDETQDAESAVRRIKQRLKERFGLEHATVEIERDDCADTAPSVKVEA